MFLKPVLSLLKLNLLDTDSSREAIKITLEFN